MGILFGLTAALCWGTSDFISGRVSRLVGVLQTMFYVQLCGLLSVAALIVLRPGTPTPHAGAWALAVVVALGNFVGTLLLYRAFTIGMLAIVAPIASGFAVVTALLALAAGERPAPLALGGALLLICGVVVVTRAQQSQQARPPAAGDERPLAAGLPPAAGRASSRPLLPAGVREALGVAVCFGAALWGLGFVTPTLGILWPVLVTKALETLGALLLLLARGSAPARLPRMFWPLVVGAGMLDNLAFLSFNTGLGSAYTSIVTALASLFSAVTVLLAWAILRERLAPAQWAGVGVILAGVLLVSL